jgi:hypothetical protein
MAAPSSLKEAHDVSDNTTGEFLNTNKSERTYARPLQMLWKYAGFAVILQILLCTSLQHEEGTHSFVQTQCGIKYLMRFEVLTQENVMFKVWV